MSAHSKYLAFDLGASSGRAVLGRFDGQRLHLEEVHRFANGPITILGDLRWNTPRLFEEIQTGLAKCAAVEPQLDGVGIDTWGVDYGLLSASGELLGLPYHYRDARTRGMFEVAFGRAPREEIYACTGIQFMELNTLYQLMAHAERDRALLEHADMLLFTPNLLNYWLTGERRGEYSIASTSQLLEATSRGWASLLMGKLGLPAHVMPPIDDPGTVVGALLPNIAEAAGLAPTTVVAPACHDTGSAVAAVPATGADWAYISSGTWSLVGVELDAPICTAEACRENFTNEGGVGGTIRFLKNVAGLWLVQECQRTWAGQGDELSFERLTAMADAAPAAVSYVDPDDRRFAEPGDMPARIQAYCAETKQAVPQSKADIVRCALESLALKYELNIAALERLTGRTIRTIHIVGGGVNNELLCQLTADIAGRLVLAGPAEATAAGNVLVQALAQGRVASVAEIREVVARSTSPKHYEPRAEANAKARRQRYTALLAGKHPA